MQNSSYSEIRATFITRGQPRNVGLPANPRLRFRYHPAPHAILTRELRTNGADCRKPGRGVCASRTFWYTPAPCRLARVVGIDTSALWGTLFIRSLRQGE